MGVIELVKSYLKASRITIYLTVVILETLALSIAQVQVGLGSYFQRDNAFLMFGVLSVISFFGHCIYYMINSYVDYVTGVDDPKTCSDRTLFEVVSVSTLLRYIVVSIGIMIGLTFYLTTLCHSPDTEWMSRMFILYFMSLMFNTLSYTHFKVFIMSIYLAFYLQNYLLLTTLISFPEVCQLYKKGYHGDSARFNIRMLNAFRWGCSLYIISLGLGGINNPSVELI
ncbi:hypothetical protein DFA_01868 [Cavenderia fasciculata]|uniref:UbiA prenyltransferase family protein n=1 Tax=Cavenderia fasciculata TaxID=261658 RepID=F4PV74_CACFS|nr:uncharacterized protein DFA_01868 [Cavenderia fasciculata]EGG21982.1 hypothetical protein DFA_01868 [Cavenderia fasciculata]|eukprot:XP_004359833.1 hypothetical protein DFA_01868 [Cavenderia fasciculata]